MTLLLLDVPISPVIALAPQPCQAVTVPMISLLAQTWAFYLFPDQGTFQTSFAYQQQKTHALL
jgi:hypothetical protein